MDVGRISAFRKIGILGGSFNPIHFGHLLMAETALDQFGLDQVIWVPTYHPPHKQHQLLSFDHRWSMVNLAIAAHPRFIASDLEQQGPHISYASVTFAQLQRLYPNTCWFWIIGSDAFQRLANWRDHAQLVAQCTWLIAPRPSLPIAQIGQQVETTLAQQNIQLHWHSLEMPQTEISSSLIRRYCQQGRSLRYLTPAAVCTYIKTHHLYEEVAPNPDF